MATNKKRDSPKKQKEYYSTLLQIEEDGIRVIIKLRKGSMFHDRYAFHTSLGNLLTRVENVFLVDQD